MMTGSSSKKKTTNIASSALYWVGKMFVPSARTIILYILRDFVLTATVAVAGLLTSELNFQKEKFVSPA
jgi:hypothetical protein